MMRRKVHFESKAHSSANQQKKNSCLSATVKHEVCKEAHQLRLKKNRWDSGARLISEYSFTS